jgi:BON domain
MNNIVALVTGAGLGASAMYVLDPHMGTNRRALLVDKLIFAQKKIKRAAFVTALDLKNRTVGLLAESRSAPAEGDVSDEVLQARVRSQLGFLVRHPSAIEVRASAGRVVLSGPVLSDEAEQLIAGVRSVQGVAELENRLQVPAETANVPGLQGDKPKPTGQPIDILQRNWSPATRFLVGTAATALLLYFARHYQNLRANLPVALALALLAYSLGDGYTLSRLPRRQRQSRPDLTREDVTAGWGA